MNPVFAHMLGRVHGFLTAARPQDSAAAMVLMKEMIQWPVSPIAQPVQGINDLCQRIGKQFNSVFEGTFEWDGGKSLYWGEDGGSRIKVLEMTSNTDIQIFCFYKNEDLRCLEVIDHAVTFIPTSPSQDPWTGECLFVDFESNKVISVPCNGVADTIDTILAMLVSTFNPNPAPGEPALVPWP